jgi:hypothetical protein
MVVMNTHRLLTRSLLRSTTLSSASGKDGKILFGGQNPRKTIFIKFTVRYGLHPLLAAGKERVGQRSVAGVSQRGGCISSIFEDNHSLRIVIRT